MKKVGLLAFNLQRFADDNTPEPLAGDNTTQTVKIGDEELTLEQIAERIKSHRKLESQFTKVSQENSDLKKQQEQLKPWLDFNNYVNQFPEDVRAEFGQLVDNFFEAKASGKVTTRDISGVNKAIRVAEKAGETETADALKTERDDVLAEIRLDKMVSDFGKQAKKDGVEFDEDEFKDYVAKYLEDEDLVEEDGSFDDRYLKVAYRLYKADKKETAFEKERKDGLPNVGSGGSGIGVSPTKPEKQPKTLKEAAEMARKRLLG